MHDQKPTSYDGKIENHTKEKVYYDIKNVITAVDVVKDIYHYSSNDVLSFLAISGWAMATTLCTYRPFSNWKKNRTSSSTK